MNRIFNYITGSEEAHLSPANVLIQRLKASVLPKDRRMAIIELAKLAKEDVNTQEEIGKEGMKIFVAVLQQDISFEDTIRATLELLINLCAPFEASHKDVEDPFESSPNDSLEHIQLVEEPAITNALSGRRHKKTENFDFENLDSTEADHIDQDENNQANDENFYSKRVASENTKLFVNTEGAVSCLIQFLEDNDFYLRFNVIELFSVFFKTEEKALVQNTILQAVTGVTKLVALLNDPREIIRNDTLRLLISLTEGSQEIAKILAFENTFESVFNIVEQIQKTSGSDELSAGVENDIVMQDCLRLINTLLRGNPFNQAYYRESGCIPRLNGLLDIKGSDSMKVSYDNSSQDVQIMLLAMESVRLLVLGDSEDVIKNKTTCANQGIFKAVIRLAFSQKFREIDSVLISALKTIEELISKHQGNHEIFASVPAIVGSPRSALIGTYELAMKSSSFTVRDCAYHLLREALCDTQGQYLKSFLNYLKESPSTKTKITPVEESMATLARLLKRTLFGWPDFADSMAVNKSACLLAWILQTVSDARNLLLEVRTETGDPVLSKCVRTLGTATREGAPIDMRIGFLTLLASWLYDSPQAVSVFLSSSMHLPLIVELMKDAKPIHGNSYDKHIQGLSALIFAECLESEESGHSNAITKVSLKSILRNRIGITDFTSLLDEFLSRISKSASKDPKSDGVIYEATFIEIYKDIYSKIRDQAAELTIAPVSPVRSPSHVESEESRVVLGSYQDLIRKQDEQIRRLSADLETLKKTERSDPLDVYRIQDFFTPLLGSLKDIIVDDELLRKMNDRFQDFDQKDVENLQSSLRLTFEKGILNHSGNPNDVDKNALDETIKTLKHDYEQLLQNQQTELYKQKVENERLTLRVRNLEESLEANHEKFEPLRNDVSQKDAVIKDLENKLILKQSENKELEEKLTSKESENKELEDKLALKQFETKDLEEKLGSKDSENKDLENKLALKQSENKDLEIRLSSKECENNDLQSKWASKQSENEQIQLQLARISDGNDDVISKMGKEISLKIHEIAELKRSIAEEKSKTSEILLQRDEQLKALSNFLEETELEKTQAKNDLKVLQDEIETLETSVAGLLDEKESLESKNKELSLGSEQVQSAKAELEKDISFLREENASLKQAFEQSENELRKILASIMNSVGVADNGLNLFQIGDKVIQKVSRLKLDLQALQSTNSKASETIKDLEHKVLELVTAGEKQNEFMKMHREVEAKSAQMQEELTSYRKKTEILQSTISEMKKTTKEKDFLIGKEHERETTDKGLIAELQAELDSRISEIQEHESKEKRHLQMIEDLKMAVAQKDDEVNKYVESTAKAQEVIAQLKLRNDEKDKLIEFSKDLEIEMREKVKSLEDKLRDSECNQESEVYELREKNKELNRNLLQNSTKLEDADRELSSLRLELEKYKSQNNELAEKISSLKDAVNHKDLQEHALSKNIKSLESVLLEKNAELDFKNAELKKLISEIADSKSTMDKLVQDHQQSLTTLLKDKEDFETKMGELVQTNQDLNSLLKEKDDLIEMNTKSLLTSEEKIKSQDVKESFNKIHASLIVQIKELKETVRLRSDKLGEMEKENERLLKSVGDSHSEKINFEKKVRALEDELAEEKERNAELEYDLELRLAESLLEIEKMKSELQEALAVVENSHIVIQESEETKKMMKSQIDNMLSMHSQLEEKLAESERVMKLAKHGFDKERDALENAIKDRNDKISILSSNMQRSKAFLASLRQEKDNFKESASVFEAKYDQVKKELEQAVAEKEFEVQVLQRERNGILSAFENCSNKFEQVLSNLEVVNNDLLSKVKQSAKYKREYELSLSRNAELHDKLKDSENMTRLLNSDLFEKDDLIQQLQDDVNKCNEEIEGMKLVENDLKDRNEVLIIEIESTKNTLATTLNELRNIKKRCIDAEKSSKLKGQRLNELNSENEALEKQVKELENSLLDQDKIQQQQKLEIDTLKRRERTREIESTKQIKKIEELQNAMRDQEIHYSVVDAENQDWQKQKAQMLERIEELELSLQQARKSQIERFKYLESLFKDDAHSGRGPGNQGESKPSTDQLVRERDLLKERLKEAEQKIANLTLEQAHRDVDTSVNTKDRATLNGHLIDDVVYKKLKEENEALLHYIADLELERH